MPLLHIGFYIGFLIASSAQRVRAVPFNLRNKMSLVWLALVVAACAGVAVQAQSRPSVIVNAVDGSRPAVLANHHPLWANAANDLGALGPQEQVGQMTLVLARSAAQQAALEQLLADQQNPTSPLYHHWLTPQEMGDRFGLSDSDLHSLTGWLESNGLQVDWVAPSRVFIAFSGTAAAVDGAFQSELHTYRVNSERRVALNSEASIPVALAPAIRAVRGLFTLQTSPNLIARTESSANPQLTVTSGGTAYHFIAPADFATIYSIPNYLSGGGQTIGIVGRSRTDMDDYAQFNRLAYTTSFSNPTEVVPTAFGGVDPGPAYTAPPGGTISVGDQSEATLDVLRAGSTAWSAKLLLVISASTKTADGIDYGAQYLVQTSPVPAQVMNISFGSCESAAGSSGVTYWDTLFQQAAGEGISVFVSSGDAGASGCDRAFTTPPANPAPNSINYICASSYATCVGGTEFNDAANPSLYWNSSSSSNLASALSYIPEGAWNEPLDSSSKPVVAATGGGVSAYVATPSWQVGSGVPVARTGRYTPDVSFSAASHDGYFGCLAAGGGSCITNSQGSTSFVVFSGTSAAAPAMAGVAALLNERMGNAQGNLNPNLYQTATQTPTAFNDVTVATSGATNCSVNTPSMCNNSIPGPTGLSGGQAGYLAGTGYDEVTGLGSLNIGNFLNGYAGKIVTQIAFSNLTTIPASQQLNFRITVSGGQALYGPTGSVVVTAGGYTSQPGTLIYGGASFSIPAYTLPVGQATLTATYTPDSASSGTYSISTATAAIQVTVPVPTVNVMYSPNPITVLQPLSASVTVAGRNTDPVPTGSVTFTCSIYDCNYSSAPATLVNGSATINIPAETIGAGMYYGVPVVNYTPDSVSSTIYAPSSGTSSLTVNFLTPTVTVTPASSTVASTDPLTVTVSVDGGSGNPTPVGTIALSGGGYSGTATLNNGSVSFTIPGGTLTTGIDTLQATYQTGQQGPPSGIYSNASASATVGVTVGSKLPPTVAITVTGFNFSVTQPVPLTASISGLSGMPTPTGTVVFSSGSYTSAAVPLQNGAASFSIPALTLASGYDTITATYTPDSVASTSYASSSGKTVVSIYTLTTTTALSLSANTITTAQTLTVTATVSGQSGYATPTGSVSLMTYCCNNYTNSSALVNGIATVTIPAGTLVVGGDSFIVFYTPDANSANLYNGSSQDASVTVTAPPLPAISLAGTAVTIQPGAASGNTSAITITPSNGFTGSVALTAVLLSAPPGYNATYLPTFSFGTTTPCVISSTTACTATMTVTTTAATSGALAYPRLPWYAAGGPALAGVLLLLLPQRRRRWLTFFALLTLITLAGGVSSCGGGSTGGSGGGGGGGGGIAGTTAGTYTVTVTGTSGGLSAQTTVTVTVQ